MNPVNRLLLVNRTGEDQGELRTAPAVMEERARLKKYLIGYIWTKR